MKAGARGFSGGATSLRIQAVGLPEQQEPEATALERTALHLCDGVFPLLLKSLLTSQVRNP